MEIIKRTVTNKDMEQQLLIAELSGNKPKARALRAILAAFKYKDRMRRKR